MERIPWMLLQNVSRFVRGVQPLRGENTYLDIGLVCCRISSRLSCERGGEWLSWHCHQMAFTCGVLKISCQIYLNHQHSMSAYCHFFKCNPKIPAYIKTLVFHTEHLLIPKPAINNKHSHLFYMEVPPPQDQRSLQVQGWNFGKFIGQIFY